MEIKSIQIRKIPGMEYKQYFKQIIVSQIRGITTPKGQKKTNPDNLSTVLGPVS